MLFATVAHAMGTAPQGGGDPTGLGGMVPILLMFVVFYFLLIRPQSKRAKEHRAMLSAVKVGDKVVTAGGLHGKVVQANDEVLVLDLGETKVTVLRSAIASVPAASALPAKDRKSKKDAKKTEKPMNN